LEPHELQHLKTLDKGDDVYLLAEPDNEHDEYAVLVMHGNIKIGYIPRGFNIDLSISLQNGRFAKATVLYNEPSPMSCRTKVRVVFDELFYEKVC